MEDVFTKKFIENSWKCDESRSGPSSTLTRTKNLREKLPILIDKLNIKSIFDAPCGDLNWMKYFIDETKITYIGGDIVLPMINSHKEHYSDIKNVNFIHIDLTSQEYPVADMMLCRDCLFHLSYDDTLKVLKNFVASRIPYLLTTTHFNKGQITNKDIVTGAWRWMDLFMPPYNFPKDTLSRITDGGGDREMCLWSREQVAQVVETWPNVS